MISPKDIFTSFLQANQLDVKHGLPFLMLLNMVAIHRCH
ncbi:MAG: hypothetical protein RIR96_650 [Bacteroidota bacterium]